MTDGDTDDGRDQHRSRTDADPGEGPVPDGDPPDAEPDAAAQGVDESGADRTAESEYDGTTTIRDRLMWVALAVLCLLALVALFQFYINASAAIDRWVAAEYRSMMQAAFNLVVLLASGIGMALVVRELTD